MALALLLAACGKTPPEQALREAMDGVQAAIEERDAAALESYLAEDFVGPDSLDREGARRMATLYLMRHDRVVATLGPLDIQLQQDHASVRFTAVLTGGSGRLLPDTGRIHDVRTGWRIEDGEWRMTSASWAESR